MLSSALTPLVVAIFFFSIISSTTQSPVKQNYTEDLLRQAKSAEMSAYFRKGEQHCENFYREVCGNWKLTYPATQAKHHTSFIGQMHHIYVSKCLSLLKDSGDTQKTNPKMLKNFFNSCSDGKALAKVDLDPVLKSINFRGGWPNVSSHLWYETEYDWLKVVADLRRKLGVNIFIELEASERLQVGEPKLTFGRRSEYNNEDFAARTDEHKTSIMKKLLKHFPEKTENWAQEVAGQVLEIEKNLAKGLVESPALLEVPAAIQEQTVSQLNSAYGSFVDLNRYLTMVFNRTITEPVIEKSPQYMNNLVEVIKRTPKLSIANYTMWRVLQELEIPDSVNDENKDFYCVEQSMKYFPKHVEDMFDQGYNAMAFGQQINSLFEELRDTLKAKFNVQTNFDWMSPTTRQRALEKAQEMKAEIVHHYHLQLEEEIKDINTAITTDNYYENIFQILQWQTKLQLSRRKQRADVSEEQRTELPRYIFEENKIRVPMAFLQKNFLWGQAYPNALKYSTIGFLLAQQMLNAFVGKGSEYDKRGDPNPWWEKSTQEAFEERIKCFEEQYENYRFQGKKVYDPKAAFKAIIDAGALSLAYQTFHRWMNSAPADVLGKEYLPNIDHKPHQLFFLAFGQMHCADYYQFLNNFDELPERLRVNGALSNLEEFANQFNCRVGSNMNPRNKCAIF